MRGLPAATAMIPAPSATSKVTIPVRNPVIPPPARLQASAVTAGPTVEDRVRTVANRPPAVPIWSGGVAAMSAVLIGPLNNAAPIPIRTSRHATSSRVDSEFKVNRVAKAPRENTAPMTAMRCAPNRSARLPAIGDTGTIAPLKNSRATPMVAGPAFISSTTKYGIRNETSPTVKLIRNRPSSGSPRVRRRITVVSGRLDLKRTHTITSARAATARAAATRGRSWICSKASSRAVMAPPMTPMSRSMKRSSAGSRLPLPGIARMPTHNATTMSGSFMRNRLRQPNASVSRPPSGAPIMPPSVMTVMM